MKRKLNKRGFTLAELLIVVAILAILIAVAIPIYTSAMRDAQIRVNTSNARALRGAAVAQILSHWTQGNSAGSGAAYSEGETNGWYAIAQFDESGKMTDVTVRNCTSKHTDPTVGLDIVSTGKITSDLGKTIGTGQAQIGAATSGNIANPNWIIVHISGTDLNK